jgi:hypothetical protein
VACRTASAHIGHQPTRPLRAAIMPKAPAAPPPLVGPIHTKAPPNSASPIMKRIARSAVGTFLRIASSSLLRGANGPNGFTARS